MRLADRRSLINSSGIRRVFDLAAKIPNPCNLSIGMPDFDVPDPVKEAAITAIRAGHNRYTPTAGIPPLKTAILEHYRAKGLDFEDVIVTSGTSGGLFMLFLAMLNPGDEVLIPDPYFVMYKHLLTFLGVVPVYVDTYPDFRVTVERLAAVATPRTRAMILNSPGNPTGTVSTAEEVRAIAAFCAERDIELISDEIYEPFSYDGGFTSPRKFHRGTIVIGGLSKTVAMTGWRIGWVLGPSDLIKALMEIQQYTFVCAPSPAQHAAIAGLRHDISEHVEGYRRRRNLIHEGLVDAGFNVTKPGGAFYIFPEAPGGDGDDFVRRAIEKELLVIPGSVFSERKSHFRISYAASEEQIMRGLSILRQVLAEQGQGAGR